MPSARSRLSTLLFALALLAGTLLPTLSLGAQGAGGEGPAALAAAASALALERTTDAHRWLAEVPAGDRGWTWHWLADQVDRSAETLIDAGSPITAFAASPDLSILAVITADGRLLLRGAEGPVRSLPLGPEEARQDPGESLRALALSPDASYLAAVRRDGAVTVFELPAGTRKWEFKVEADGVGALAFSPDGAAVALGGFRRHPETRRPVGFVELRSRDGALLRSWAPTAFFIGALAFAPGGGTLAAGGPQGKLDLLALADGGTDTALEITESRGFPQIHDLAFSADGERLVAACGDGTLRFWSTAGWQPLGTPTAAPVHRAGARAVAFETRTAGVVSGGTDLVIRLAHGPGEPPAEALLGHRGTIVGLAVGPGGEVISAAEDGTVRRWETADLEAPLIAGESVWGMAFRGDGRRLATADGAGRVRIWDPQTRELVREIAAHEGDAVSVLFAAGGSQLVSTGNDGRLRVWSAESGEMLAELEDVEDGRGVALSLSPDGRTLAAGSSRGTVKLWDLGTRKHLATLAGHDGEVSQALFTPDGSRLVTVAADGQVITWEAAPGTERARFRAHDGAIHGAALSPDGTLLATAGEDRTLHLWDLASGKLVRAIPGHAERVWSLAFSPDGHLLASASNDYTARLWDVATGLPLIVWPHPIEVYKVLWSPGGETLAIAPFDGEIRLLTVPQAAPKPEAAPRP